MAGLGPDLESVGTQIPSGPAIPTMEEVFVRLLRSTQAFTGPESAADGSIRVSQATSFGNQSKNKQPQHGRKGGKWLFCLYFCKPGHYKETWCALHG